MASAVQRKIKPSPSRDILFRKLVLSRKDVSPVKAGIFTDASSVAVVAKVLGGYPAAHLVEREGA
ncbi:hypothetical protein ACVI1L_005158 [Bradyrhizobium sp. USDA 4516]